MKGEAMLFSYLFLLRCFRAEAEYAVGRKRDMPPELLGFFGELHATKSVVGCNVRNQSSE